MIEVEKPSEGMTRSFTSWTPLASGGLKLVRKVRSSMPSPVVSILMSKNSDSSKDGGVRLPANGLIVAMKTVLLAFEGDRKA